jgi:hypothetical protein
MRLGMMQPYFFPYLGYFGLIHATDRWVVFDTPQYIRRGWVNRNRVLSAGQTAWKYVRVPIAQCERSTPISGVRVHPTEMWRKSLLDSLDVYRLKGAPRGVARSHGLPLLFDASHAFGCKFRGVPVGGLGDAEAFSFHATKVL